MWFFKFSAVEARVLIWRSLSLKHKTAPKNAWEEAASNQFSSCWYLEPKPGNCQVENHERSGKEKPAGKGDRLAVEFLDKLVHHLASQCSGYHATKWPQFKIASMWETFGWSLLFWTKMSDNNSVLYQHMFGWTVVQSFRRAKWRMEIHLKKYFFNAEYLALVHLTLWIQKFWKK